MAKKRKKQKKSSLKSILRAFQEDLKAEVLGMVKTSQKAILWLWRASTLFTSKKILFWTLLLTILMGPKALAFIDRGAVHKAQYSVLKLTLIDNYRAGGTGFIIDTVNGLRTLSNAHICAISDDGYLMAHQDEKPVQILKVLYISEKTDLCLLEAVLGVDPIPLGKMPSPKEQVIVVGHPRLQPVQFAFGALTGRESIDMVTGYYNEETCTGPGARAELFGLLCVRSYMSYSSTVRVFGGNSGSPVLNERGRVVAVVFAADTQTNRGYFIPYEDVLDIISKK